MTCKKHSIKQQDQTSNRYDSILLYLLKENGFIILSDLLTYSHTPNPEMLSHLKIVAISKLYYTM